MRKITATFSVDEALLIEKYKEYYDIDDFGDALTAEFEVMEENGVSLVDWREEKPAKHFAIMCDYAMEEDAGRASSGVVAMAIVHSRDEAERRLANFSAADREYVKTNGWVIRKDVTGEFDAGDPSNYERCHVHFFVVEVN